jgi:hypothetical protein
VIGLDRIDRSRPNAFFTSAVIRVDTKSVPSSSKDDQSFVKEGVEMNCQQKPIVGIKTLFVAGIAPRFDMGRPQHFGHVNL